jgi:hypothetical protein
MQGEGYCECGCGGLAPLAQRSDPRRGHVKGKPHRFIAGHQRRPTKPQYEIRDCGYDTPCWVWQWSLKGDGYGQAVGPNGPGKAHRIVYERLRGPIPAGLELDHLCRNPLCVNPDHLEPVTHQENLRRGSRVLLTPEVVREIRASAEITSTLARRYGVAPRTINAVRKRETWKEIV